MMTQAVRPAHVLGTNNVEIRDCGAIRKDFNSICDNLTCLSDRPNLTTSQLPCLPNLS